MIPGDRVGERFCIERAAGVGGMGAVYRARDERTGAAIALKVMHSGFDESHAERFEREARVLAELNHPRVVRYMGHGRTPAGEPWLAMEWLEGEDLAARLARGGLGEEEAIGLVRDVAHALAAAHAGGIVHRDIKPSNLFLPGCSIAQVTVLDFGIASAAGAGAMTRTGAILGTPGYMAPEQARGDRGVGPAADVFALGCVLFECVAGRAAFEGQHVMAVLARVLLGEAPRLREVRPGASAALEALISRMLARAPTDRPADGAAVLAEIAALGAVDERLAAAPSGTRGPESLTEQEERFACVVLMRSNEPSTLADELAATRTADEDAAAWSALRAAVGSFGVVLERMVDGSIVALLDGKGGATEQAARAARCALALWAAAPTSAVAIAMGRGRVVGRVPVGAVIDRAVSLLGERGSAVVVDQPTAALLDARFEVELGPRGLELRGEREGGERVRTLLGRATPCVGRQRELRALAELFEECAGESVARCALVTAPAGAGKSRVLHELLQQLRRSGATFELWRGRGESVHAGSVFGILAPSLRRAAGITDGEPLATQHAKLRHVVDERVPLADRVRVAEFLGELTGAVVDGPPSVLLRAARHDARVMHEQLLRAWVDFARAECELGPLLLVVDDLHWGDRASVALLNHALGALADRPFMVLALARPEVHDVFPRLWSERELQEVRLPALTKRASEQLARAALGEAATPERIAAVVERAGGNAFFLEELIRAAAEGDVAALPDTVLAVVQARLDGLEPEARRVLRAASVFGETFWSGGIAALLGGTATATRATPVLDSLLAHELVVHRENARFPGEREYVFRHALTREAAYAMLTEQDIVRGHRLAAAWLEGAGETDPTVLAHHCERGGEGARAAGYYLRAAEHALAGGDLEGAAASAALGIQAGASPDHRLALEAVALEVRLWRGDIVGCAALSATIMSDAPRGGRVWCTAAGHQLFAALALNRGEESAALAAELLGVEPDADAAVALVPALSLVAAGLYFTGAYPMAIAVTARMEQLAPSAAAQSPVAEVLARKTAAYRTLYVDGDACSAAAQLEGAVAAFRAAGNWQHALDTLIDMGLALILAGDGARAETALREALSDAEARGHGFAINCAKVHLVGALDARDRTDEAIALGTRAVEDAAAREDPMLEGMSRFWLARAHVHRGDHDAAAAEVERARPLLAVSGPMDAWLTAYMARVWCARKRGPEALHAARDAVALLGSVSDSPLQHPAVHGALAEAQWLCGDAEAARATIRIARDRLMARAARIVDGAERSRFLDAVAEHAHVLALARAQLAEEIVNSVAATGSTETVG